MKKLTILVFTCIALVVQAQHNRLIVDKSDGTKTEIFMNGGNLAWDQFANDFGPGATNFEYFDEVFTTFENAGGNSMRLWIHINGANNPNFNANGACTGLEESHLDDMRTVLNLAYNHNIVLVMSLWSFDMLNNRDYPIEVSDQGLKILTVESNVTAYIDNALIPMVQEFKDHPAVGAWEIFNEPEGMSNEFGWSHTRHVPMSVIQRFVNRCAGAIHRTDPDAQVTNGTWSMYAGTDIFTSNNPIYKNYYSDAELIAAGGDASGTLDYYQIHYYDWMNNEISVMHNPASHWQLDKPILVGEFYPKDAKGITWQTYHKLLYSTGYAGALSWQWYGEQGQTEPYRTNMVALMNSIKDSADIKIETGRNRYPSMGKIDNGLYYVNADPVTNYVNLDSVSSDADNDPLTYSIKSNSNPGLVAVSIDANNQLGLSFTANLKGEATIVVQAADPAGLSATTEFGIAVRETGTGNLALYRKTVYSSSNEPGTSTADPIFATDGDYNTRWSSAYVDPTWYYIDLGAEYNVSQVKLFWENAYGQRYEIQVSNDATAWTTVFTENSGNGAEDDIVFPAVAARYVRMYGVQRGTQWGYSLYEFEVYGAGGANQAPVVKIAATPTTGNIPLAVSLDASASSDSDGTIANYEWSFDDGTTATGVTVSRTYSVKGTYTPQLTITDDDGAKGTATVTIIVNDPNDPNNPPVAKLSANPISGTEPLKVVFSASASTDSDGTISSYNWEYGDGDTGTGVEVSHTYTTPGTYYAVLFITDNEGAHATDTANITVNPWVPCANPSTITLPFKVDGVGDRCYVTNGTINYLNSWNMEKVEINGVDITNIWTSTLPPKKDGKYYIYYKGKVEASHLETDGTGGTTIKRYALSSSVIGQGSIIPASGRYDSGKVVTLIAIPVAGWEFSSWGGDATGTDTITSVSMDTTKSVIATFTEITGQRYTLTSSVIGQGSIIPANGTYAAGTNVSLAAVPAAGWEFSSWGGDATGTDSTTSVTMNTDKSVTATFTEITGQRYTLFSSVIGQGSVSPASGRYDSGTVVTLTAVPSAGWEFSSWGGDASGTDTITSVTMDSARSVIATFTEIPGQQYTLSVDTIGQGTVTLSPSGGTYAAGTIVTLTAIPSSGYQFDNWSGAVTDTLTSPTTITMSADLTVTANFSQVPTGCSNPVNITVPINQDGVGDYCWVTTDGISNVNSWNMDLLEINGVDFTNKYSSNLPPAVNGQWVIHYKGSLDWAHFEASALKGAEGYLPGSNNQEPEVHPNPFTNEFTINLKGHTASRIELINQLGQLIATYSGNDLKKGSILINTNSPGSMFFIRIHTKNDVIIKTLIRK